MLAAPLIVGTLASHPVAGHVVLAAFWFTGYFAFFATSLWLKSGRRDRFRTPMITYAVASAALGVAVLVLRSDLVRWAPLFVLPLGVGMVAASQRRERALLAGLTTILGSSLIAPVAYDLGGGTNWRGIWIATAVVAAYFVGTTLYVKTIIRERGSTAYLIASIGYHGACCLAMLAVSPWLVAIFAVLTLRAAVVPRLRVTPKQVGIAEAFGTVAVVWAVLGVL